MNGVDDKGNYMDKSTTDIVEYNAVVIVTADDYKRIECNNIRIVKYLPVRKVIFVGNVEVGKMVENSQLGEKAGYVNENDIISFQDVYNYMKEIMSDILCGRELPRGIVGWYYQQFLKMKYAMICNDEYYMSWDGDTVPCKAFSMFDSSGKPYFDMKHEYHEEYFITMYKILPEIDKIAGCSFISEHMIFNRNYMKELIATIEKNDNIKGNNFWKKILNAIRIEHIQENSFSEFETYGNYMMIKHPEIYEYRNWHSFRYGGYYFHPEKMTERDYEWMGKDFYAISFEKLHSVREDHENLFNNPRYQEKLTARQMVEIVQEESEGYNEVWDD